MCLFATTTASAENAVRPEIVQLENVLVEGDMRTVYVGNANNHYLIYCNTKAEGCFTPEENKNYFLFTESTRWMLPGAMTLAFMQEFNPMKGTVICRDWNTGKLVSAKHAQQ